MLTEAPFSIIYLGKDGSDYNFFVNIGKVCEELFHTNYLNPYISDLASDLPGIYSTMYDGGLSPVQQIGIDGKEGFLHNYRAPLKVSVTLTESGPIYLKIPKVPVGSGYNSAYSRGIWFTARQDVAIARAFLMWEQQFEIVSSINSDDLLYTQKRDVLEPALIDLPLNIPLNAGGFYIKIADIEIVSGAVTVKPYLRSNFRTNTRYITIGSNINRGLRVYFVGKQNIGTDFDIVVGDYSRPDWITKTRNEILESCKTDIQADFGQYYNNWEVEPGIKADNLEIIQIIALYKKRGAGPILATKVFEDETYADNYIPFSKENLSLIFPGLNQVYLEIE